MAAEKVLLGMSGGADSSMAAILLKESGYDVTGVTLNVFLPQSEDPAIEEARQICHSIGIHHMVIKARTAFQKQVVNYFKDAYISGATPNPCIRCNTSIKWKYLLETAEKKGFKYIATGHYASVVWHNSRYYISKALDPAKDQSFFLWNLPQEVLSRALFPLGHLRKKEIKEMAIAYGLPQLAEKKESMGVCFLQNENYRTFLSKLIPTNHLALSEGIVANENGTPIGHHNGYLHYTQGQKKGIEPPLPPDWCILEIDPKNNLLIAGPTQRLLTSNLLLSNYTITSDQELWKNQPITIRVRGLDSVPGYPGHLTETNEGLQVNFHTPAWALTPGQSVVFYQEDLLIGGAELPIVW